MNRSKNVIERLLFSTLLPFPRSEYFSEEVTVARRKIFSVDIFSDFKEEILKKIQLFFLEMKQFITIDQTGVYILSFTTFLFSIHSILAIIGTFIINCVHNGVLVKRKILRLVFFDRSLISDIGVCTTLGHWIPT